MNTLNNMSMDKKAWIKIIEASLAVLIVLGAIMVLAPIEKSKNVDVSERVYEKERQILDIIAHDDDLREKVLSSISDPSKMNDVKDYISKGIPGTWNYDLCIVRIDQTCTPLNIPYDRDVYVSETIVTSTLSLFPNQKTSRLRLFVWVK